MSTQARARERHTAMTEEWEAGALQSRIRRELPHLGADETNELAWIVARLVDTFRPESVYVFGSQARGTPTPDSDVDLLVVVSEAVEPAYRLSQQAFGVIGNHTLPLDIVFMAHDEFRRRARAAASLPAAVLREGRVLYGASA